MHPRPARPRSSPPAPAPTAERAAGQLYLRMANRRFDQALHDLDHNDDPATSRTAAAVLEIFLEKMNGEESLDFSRTTIKTG